MKTISYKIFLFMLAAVFLVSTGFTFEHTITDDFESNHENDSFHLKSNGESLTQSNDSNDIENVITDRVTTGTAMEMSSMTLGSMQTEGVEVLECTSATWSGGSFNLPNPPQGQIGVGFDEGPTYNSWISSMATWSCPESFINKIDTIYAVSLRISFRNSVSKPGIIIYQEGASTEFFGSQYNPNAVYSKDITALFNRWLNGESSSRAQNVIPMSFYVNEDTAYGYDYTFWDIEGFNIVIEYRPISNEPTVSYTTTQPAVTNIIQSASYFNYNSYNSTHIVAGAYEDDYYYYTLSTDFGISFPQPVLDSIKILNSATLKVYFSDNRSGDIYINSLSTNYNSILSGNPGVSSGWYAMDMTNTLAIWLNRRGTGTEHRFRVFASQITDWYEGFVKIEGSHETLYAKIELEYVPRNYMPDTPTSLSPDSGTIMNISDSFSFYYSDYDGDTMSKCRFQYRDQGASEWITTDEINISTLSDTYVTYTFPPETFLNGTIYEWQVASFDGALWSDWSQTAVFVTNSPPTIPAGLNPDTLLTTINATVSNDFSFVYIDPNNHTMIQYQIRYKIESEPEWILKSVVQKALESGTGCICTISSNTFEVGRSYAWQVRVYDGFLWSDWSESACFKTNTPPDRPTMLTPDADTITVDPTVSNNLSFLYSDIDLHDMSKCQIRFKVLPLGNWTESSVNTVSYPSNTAVLYDLLENTLERDSTYEWQARAYDGQAWSLWSDSALLRTDSVHTAPGTPVLLHPIGLAKSIDVKYCIGFSLLNQSSDITQYQIQYRQQGGNWTTCDPVDNTRPGNKNITHMFGAYTFNPNCTYEWQAKVFDGVSWSDWSAIAPFITTDVTAAGSAKYVAIQAADISGTINKHYKVLYNPSIYKLSDLCIFTGHPSDYGIHVTQVDEINGIIRLTVVKEVGSGMWTGLVNILRFDTLVDNNLTITMMEE